MAEGIQIKNLPSTTTIKQGDTMTIVQDKQNKQLALDVFANESDLATLSPLENRCDEVKAKIEVDEYSAEITTSQSMSEIGSDDSGVDLHENVLDGAFESCVLKGKTKYRDIDTGEILEDFEEGRNLELITVRMPILKTCGKNLIVGGDTIKEFTKDTDFNINYPSFKLHDDVHLNSLIGKALTVSCRVKKTVGKTNNPNQGSLGGRFGIHGTLRWTNASGQTKTEYPYVGLLSEHNNNTEGVISQTHTFTPPSGYDRISSFNFSIQLYARPSGNDTWSFGQVQMELGSSATTYEPHKSSILSLPEEVVLRSLPDGTCDTLNAETGEYVQKIGERNYQDGDTNSNTLVTDGTKTHYKLSSPITTKVDVQGFPHAYKNGHIQLSSGSTEPSLTPTVTYKVPVSRVGQIASNTKSNLRQTIKLDQLEILAYQSLINAEYENLLVQNSAESAASFTNLSTNDPKDELYYMLKHLIEENQPVQNMLDKINLFYLYGLLSDEHYFDLLLGGEEDVY